ncbi:NAD-dependent epimerase/dehydratase family protein [Microbulbifer hydrolyticus]|uniref:NAD-dependent epimerase/dehydratase family protein n=1 Tax=Microbulbifer hydrolyticus TaxID=48074 RepID=A0A6P1TC68_9GAMM|nr:NAD-dependent epimerase/dehydratase family protein [Microbulbifer hydrolyticus]MBB5210078.1 nucleoside-diphosphate-sugar epimerase [Microbulbifer hydrolyticus]QHQ39401.1 NAD-dependent epimerase/dehydratase family protein [Microbulbifer hydrolyticus]
MRWVVIGSSGYIGSALCQYLVQAGLPVLSVSRRETGPAGCAHFQIPVFSASSFSGVFREGDIVVYAAGLASARGCRKRPELAALLNSTLPDELLVLADRSGAHQFLYLSSIKAKRAPAYEVASEDSGEPATDVYGGSKWEAEKLLLSRACSTRINILRPAAVYGACSEAADSAGTRLHKRAFLWKARLRAWCNWVSVVPCTGFRSFVALEDLLSAIVRVGESPCNGETFIIAEPGYYNLAAISTAASGRRIRNSQLLTWLALFPFRLLSVFGVETGVLEVERSELYSAQRLKSRLKWQPQRRYSQFLGEG